MSISPDARNVRDTTDTVDTADIPELKRVADKWENYANDYLSNATRWAKAFIGATAALACVIGVFVAIYLFVTINEKDIGVSIQRVAFFGTFIALIVWGLRQTLRMWAFYDDLRIEAREKIALLNILHALKGVSWFKASDVTVIVTALAQKTRRSSIIAPEAPSTPIDVLAKEMGKKLKGKVTE